MNGEGDTLVATAGDDTGERGSGASLELPTRPFYWSLRRELWENRSLYLAPLAVVAVLLFGFLVTLGRQAASIAELPELAPAERYAAIIKPFSAAAGLPVVTLFLVCFFYCLDALNGERRDRSILFWKSLPVSDRTTVLAKAAVPYVVLPLLSYPLILATQVVMAAASSLALAGRGASLGLFWENLALFEMWVAILYALVVIAFWHAPVYAWLLLVSAWARRAAILWALLPPLALAGFERMVVGTSWFGELLGHRLFGWYTLGFREDGPHAAPLAHVTPWRVLASPGLWLGLLFAAGCLAAAVRLRRHREPI